MGTETCSLPYPDRFHAAVAYVDSLPDNGGFSQDVQLLFYSLNQQATLGECKETKPWGWNVIESAKWQSWKQLGNMNGMEAMRLLVRTLEEEQADWFTRAVEQAAKTDDAAPDVTVVAVAPSLNKLESIPYDEWSSLDVESARKPVPRYEQGSVVADGVLYVVGGNYAGRYLGDVWALQLDTQDWSQITLEAAEKLEDGSAASGPVLAPCAGHTLSAFNKKLYLIGGHAKGAANQKSTPLALRVQCLDVETKTVTTILTTGETPTARGNHSTSLIGSKLYVFGGEDSTRRPLDDLAVLDLKTLSWETPITQGIAPLARAAHVGAVYKNRYLVVFGGGSVATCLSDVHVLDTVEMKWSKPAVSGVPVMARAGHAGAVLGDSLYVLGGGNNVKGCTDMLSLDLRALPEGKVEWRNVSSIPARDPLSSEGVSLIALKRLNGLIAFGGYNGKYHNSVKVFRAPPSSTAQQGAEAPGSPNNTSAPGTPTPSATEDKKAPSKAEAAEAKVDPPMMNGTNASTKAAEKAAAAVSAAKELAASAAKEAAAMAAKEAAATAQIAIEMAAAVAAKEAAAHELSLMRKQLATAQVAVGEKEKGLEEAKGSLQKEQGKVMKLEAEIARLMKQLEGMSELEREVEKWRKVAKEAETKTGKGIWGYVTG